MFDDDLDRRAFVKGCIKAGVAGLGIGAGLGLTAPLDLREGDEDPAPERRVVEYLGARKVDGPATRALPVIPLTVEDGTLKGSPRLLGEDILEWFRYCGRDEAPALRPGHDPETEAFVYREGDRTDPWYGDRVGEPARREHFDEVPKGAPVTWRSQGADGKDVVPAVLLRLDPEAVATDDVRVQEAGLEEGFLAFMTACTHFCCVPGWKHAPDQAKPRDAWDHLFCTCCYSHFDPRAIVADEFVLDEDGA